MANKDATKKDIKKEVFDQKEGDIFLKHNEDPKSTAVIIRNNQIIAHTKEGKIGIKIQENGTIFLQGAIDMQADSKNISRFTYPRAGQQVTENPQSTVDHTMMWGSKETQLGGGMMEPHTHKILDHDHEIVPPYLRKMTDVSELKEIKGLLMKFLGAV